MAEPTLDEQIAAIEEERAKQSDEFYSREQIIETLTNVLEQQKTQPVYIQPGQEVKSPNYLLYIGLAIAGLFLFKKVKL